MQEKPDFNVKLPNLLIIPFVAILGAIIKLFGGTSMEYYQLLVIMPLLIYFGWSIAVLFLMLIAAMTKYFLNIMKGL